MVRWHWCKTQCVVFQHLALVNQPQMMQICGSFMYCLKNKALGLSICGHGKFPATQIVHNSLLLHQPPFGVPASPKKGIGLRCRNKGARVKLFLRRFYASNKAMLGQTGVRLRCANLTYSLPALWNSRQWNKHW